MSPGQPGYDDPSISWVGGEVCRLITLVKPQWLLDEKMNGTDHSIKKYYLDFPIRLIPPLFMIEGAWTT
eukprot:6336617-Lingulodinium_polyedra.AAC.1